jgi:hypothetical protein
MERHHQRRQQSKYLALNFLYEKQKKHFFATIVKLSCLIQSGVSFRHSIPTLILNIEPICNKEKQRQLRKKAYEVIGGFCQHSNDQPSKCRYPNYCGKNCNQALWHLTPAGR